MRVDLERDRGIRASNLRRIDKNTLVGTVDIEVPAWRLKLKGCLWHRKNAAEWIAFPARGWVNKAGDRQFADLVEITDRPVRDRFQAAALQAVRELAGGRAMTDWANEVDAFIRAFADRAAAWRHHLGGLEDIDPEPWIDPDHPDPVLDVYRSGIVRSSSADNSWDNISSVRGRIAEIVRSQLGAA